jgi:hypothetical protein
LKFGLHYFINPKSTVFRMKRFVILLLCYFFITVYAFAQRNVDLSVTMSSPAAGSVITASQDFTFAATLTNNGPDTIKTKDTLVIAFYLDNGTNPQNLVVTGQNVPALAATFSQALPPGASANLSQAISLATFPGAGAHSLCANAIILNRSIDSVHETQPGNNRVCANVTFQNPTAIANVAGNGELFTLYPNPATDASALRFDLPSAQQVSIVVTDLNGRIVLKEEKSLPSGTSTVTIPTSDMAAGTYLCKVHCAALSQCSKLIVVH